jgi:ABC transport system ATP-binding/permease protein
VAELTHVNKRFGDKLILEDVSCVIQRGDKVGLVGPNGCGKTTLLKLVLGELEADAGKIERGIKMTVAYFDQFRVQLDDEATLAGVISPGSEFVEIDGARKHVVSYLGDFLFPPERARAKVASLSGGERNRLLLARLFAQPANVLVLDEPTNDLDIETLDLLEALLQEYTGTVLLVSHDRAFLDSVVTQILVFEGAGRVCEYAGGYEDNRATIRARAKARDAAAVPAQKKAAVPARGTARKKLGYQEARELAALPDRIASLETAQAGFTEKLGDAALYRGDGAEATTLRARLAAIEAELSAAYARWEALEARAGELDEAR